MDSISWLSNGDGVLAVFEGVAFCFEQINAEIEQVQLGFFEAELR